MKEHISEYKDHLSDTVGEYMKKPVTERSAMAVKGMVECWMCLDDAESKIKYGHGTVFSAHDAEQWNKGMKNVDGSTGPHWTEEQTTAVAKSVGVTFDHMNEKDWNVAMNAMWSDYCMVARKHGVDTPTFYADMAKAFLFDPDGGKPMDKLKAYYDYIVKPER